MIRVFTAFLLIALYGACSASRFESRLIADPARAETLVFKTPRSNVHAIVISASGSIDGRAEVQLILNGSVYQRKDVTGKFETEFLGDWYSQEAEVRYAPQNVTKGEVAIKVRFRSS